MTDAEVSERVYDLLDASLGALHYAQRCFESGVVPDDHEGVRRAGAVNGMICALGPDDALSVLAAMTGAAVAAVGAAASLMGVDASEVVAALRADGAER